jgi:hypothetical protein
MLVGLAAVGGVSSAAYQVEHLAKIATGQTRTFVHRTVAVINLTSAADTQYGTTTEATTTTTQTVTTQTAQTAETQSTASTPGSTSTLTVQAGTTDTQIAVTFVNDSPTVINLSATTISAIASALVGADTNQVVTLTASDANGNPVLQVSTPISVLLSSVTSGGATIDLTTFAPVFITTGSAADHAANDSHSGRAATPTVLQVPLLSGTTLPADQKLGYYVDSNGKIVVLTKLIGTVGLVKKANITVSESGKKTPTAGSGKFGDPTRNQAGPTKLTKVGAVKVMTAGRVPFAFHVNEQAAVYITIVDSSGKPVWISQAGTTVRGHTYTGSNVHTLHLVILRPGLIKTLLNVPGLQAGQKYTLKVRAVDFDGHVTSTSTSFTA